MPEVTNDPMLLIWVGLAAYLLGSIPFGMVVAKLMGLGNLRDIGSGNIGATNVLRTGNKTAAFLTLLFDAGKGGIAVLIAWAYFGETAAQFAGFFAFIGHLYPVWLTFKGGKGVATFFGIIFALNFWVGLAAGATWLGVAYLGRMSSLAALVSSILTPLYFWLFGMPTAIILGCVLAGLIWLRHLENITRILNKTESKIGQK